GKREFDRHSGSDRSTLDEWKAIQNKD
nr:Chain w, SERBP1 [Oryctolagus cuniculus]